MMDPTVIQLNKVLYRERLQEAVEARQRSLTWVVALSPLERLQRAFGIRRITLGQHVQACEHTLSVR